jgi:acyl dehydratase
MMSAEDIVRFSRDYDPQYFHVDAEAAKDSIFGGLVASGWHTATLTMRLLIEEGAPFADGVVGAGVDLSWPRPVRPGDSLRVEAEVVDIRASRSRKGRGVVTFLTTTKNQNGEAVQIQTAKLMVFSGERGVNQRALT